MGEVIAESSGAAVTSAISEGSSCSNPQPGVSLPSFGGEPSAATCLEVPINDSALLSQQYAELKLLSGTVLNGDIGFVLGDIPGNRFAVFVPSISRRLSMHGTKLRVLSQAVAE